MKGAPLPIIGEFHYAGECTLEPDRSALRVFLLQRS